MMAYPEATLQIQDCGKLKEIRIGLHRLDRATFDLVPVAENLIQNDQPGAKCFWTKHIDVARSGSRGPIYITLYCKEPPNA